MMTRWFMINGQCYNTEQLIDDDSVVYDERTVL